MKKAFTLIELLIVIAVLVILMGLVFKLTTVGGASWRRMATISRLQRLENCLSGYHAAFGTYPPVKLHGSRDIYRKVGGHGLQTDDVNKSIWGWRNIGEQAERYAWEQVKAACKAQPIDCRFPYPEGYDVLVQQVSEEMKRRATSGDNHFKNYWENDAVRARLTAGFDDGVTQNRNRHSKNKGKTAWNDIQLFKFGVMSFLLPRYLVMMNTSSGMDDLYTEYAQWTGNNQMPSNPFTGNSYESEGGWTRVRELASSQQATDLAKIANIPSQAVCARWMPNLEGICQCNHNTKLFGISIRDTIWSASELDPDNYNIEIYSPGSADSNSTATQYVLDGVTVRDGWWNEFYYYSPAPYQHYTLWSGGPNGRTFPPWVDRENGDGMSAASRRCIALWTEDDYIHMSN